MCVRSPRMETSKNPTCVHHPYPVKSPIPDEEEFRVLCLDSGSGAFAQAQKLVGKFTEQGILAIVTVMMLSAQAPFGEKPSEEVADYGMKAIRKAYVNMGFTTIIIACNTLNIAMSKHKCFESLAKDFPDLQLLNVVEIAADYIKQCVPKTKKLLTLATPKSKEQKGHQIAVPQHNTITVGCPEFAPLIDAGKEESDEMRRCTRTYLKSIAIKDLLACTYLWLACTHYPLALKVILEEWEEIIRGVSEEMKQPIKVIDPAVIVANILCEERLKEQNGKRKFLNPDLAYTTIECWTTGRKEDVFKTLIHRDCHYNEGDLTEFNL